jgi:hypothetical protein
MLSLSTYIMGDIDGKLMMMDPILRCQVNSEETHTEEDSNLLHQVNHCIMQGRVRQVGDDLKDLVQSTVSLNQTCLTLPERDVFEFSISQGIFHHVPLWRVTVVEQIIHLVEGLPDITDIFVKEVLAQ